MEAAKVDGGDRPRSVASPQQARLFLAKVGEVKLGNEREPKYAKRYVAFFGCMYYAALRPRQVGALRTVDLELPSEGWGWLLVSQSDAEISPAYGVVTASGLPGSSSTAASARFGGRRVRGP